MPDADEQNILVDLLAEIHGQPEPPEEGAHPSVPLRIVCLPGQSLAQAVYLSGLVAPPVLCSGLAVCGRCRMRILSPAPPAPLPSERQAFSDDELALGWRLACRHQPVPGMRLVLPSGSRRIAAPAPGARVEPPLFHAPLRLAREDSQTQSCLAVDLGTTSLHWRHFMRLPHKLLALDQGVEVNPQMGAGSDVISRLAAASRPGGGERLALLTQDALKRLTRLCGDSARSLGFPDRVDSLCLAANPAMTAITLGLALDGLTRAPYALPHAGGDWQSLPGLPPLWLPPQLSPFVGGDITAGYAALALDPDRPAPAYPFLLADLGTNGEFLLALSPDTTLAASVALGPALEGIGLSQGTEARPSAVCAFSLSPGGLQPLRLPATASEPSEFPGITGTGYLSLLHVLLNAKALDRDGHFSPEACGPFKKFLSPTTASGGEARLTLPAGLSLPASDIEEILKVKAAFSLGLRRLLESAGLAFHQLQAVYTAGAFGEHVNKASLENLGFFPQGAEQRLQTVGNTSLEGASLLLRRPEIRSALRAWSRGVSTLDLANDDAFKREFAEHMRFSW